ncbi:MAG: DivIVA domain-containing protein [Firmicutes bacterium]|nr:DivIVA domain-containing protein [Bacillota bacterium]
MTLTPLDIHNKEFHRTFRGYSEAEVDEFLDLVVKEFEALIRENGELKDRLDELEQVLERYRTIEDSLNKTLLLAQQAAEEVRQTSEREAEVIREKARMEAQRLLEEARARAKQALDDYAEIRREAELFRLRMKTMLQAQLEIFSEADRQEAEAGTTPFATSPRLSAIAARYTGAAERDQGSPARAEPASTAAREEAATLDYRRPEPARPAPAGLPSGPGQAADPGSAPLVRPNLWGEPVTVGRTLPGRTPTGSAALRALTRGREPEDGDEEEDTR